MINSLNNNAYFNLKSQELARQHRNKTASQKNQVNKTLEGVVVNNFIKDENQGAQGAAQGSALNMDDICNALIIPTASSGAGLGPKNPSNPGVPDANLGTSDANSGVPDKKEKSSMLLSALPLAATALALVGGGLGLTKIFQKSAASLNDKNILKA